MSRRNRDSITMTGAAANSFVRSAMADLDNKLDATGSQTTDEDNAAEMAPGAEQHEPDGPPHKDTEEVVNATPKARGWDDIIAEYSGIESQRDGIDKRLATLAAELGELAAKHGKTRGIITVRGVKRKFYRPQGATAFQLVPYKAPSEIEGVS